MISSLKKIALILALLLYVSGLQAQPDFQAVQQNIADRLAEGNFLGVSIAYIYPDGRTQYINRGALTTARNKTVDNNTIFEIGSISKTFTALMMMKMAEEGAFSLDTPIETLLPDNVSVLSYEGKKITLKHLATHTAGLPSVPSNLKSSDPLNPYADYTVQQMYDFLNGYKLSEAPGSSHAYSNLEVGLLGHILEVQSGKSYEQLLNEYIADPLNMEDTYVIVPDSKEERFADPYNYGAPVKHWDIPTLAGAGAIRSTAENMAVYMKAQLRLQESDLESAIKKTHQIRFDTGNGVIDDIGLGWFYSTKEDTIVWHNGGTGGFQSFAGFNKEKGTAVVVLSNGKESVDDIGFHLLDTDHSLKKVQVTATVDSTSLDSYTGTYQHSNGVKYYVSREGDQLLVQITGQSVNPVFQKSENRFFYKVVDAEIEFTDQESGEFQKLTLYQAGQEIPANRISDETAPPKRAEVDIDPALLERYTGTYQLATGFNMKVRKEGNQLMTQATGQQKFPVYPESETKFFLKVADTQIEFVPDEDGNFNTIKLYQAGRVLEGKRVQN